MSKKIITVLLTGLMCFYGYGMEFAYLKFAEKYADFRLTRSYGKPLKSNFDCLSGDIFDAHIKPYLSKLIVTKYKQRLLNYKYELNGGNKPVWQAACLDVNKRKPFQYHDGTYVIVPDVAEYAMWDGHTKERYIHKTKNSVHNEGNKDEYIRLLADYKTQSAVGLYCSKDFQGQKNCFIL